MAPPEPSTFGLLLRQHRSDVGLTQEALADRAQISVRTVSDLERGVIQHPQAHTARGLAHALGLSPDQEQRFTSAARHRMASGVQAEEHQIGRSPPNRGAAHVTAPAGVADSAIRKGHLAALPNEPASFIGREREVALLVEKLRQSDVHLLTLTGPGGIGKTRLALRAGRELAGWFAHGAAFVSLASYRSPDLIAVGIAAALGLTEGVERPSDATLVDYLRDKEMLLILDNFEHLLAAGRLVSDLIAACPGLKVVVTSRTVLHVAAEHVVEVSPLSSPDPEIPLASDGFRRYDAMALFAVRAQARDAGFSVTADNATAVAAICRRVDGLPLAIELAAARVHIFPPRALLGKLSHRLELLTGGPHDFPLRHQTLRNTIDWSYDLLTPREQKLFARLSVFRGGCTLEAAETICNVEHKPEIDFLEDMASLVEKSLLRQNEHADGEPRFSMLETVREYAQEALDKRGEWEILRQRHAQYFTDLAERIGDYFSQFRTDDFPSTFALRVAKANRIAEEEQQNLDAALTWLVERRDATLGLRLAGVLWQAVSELCLSIDLSAALKTLLSQPDDLSPLVLARAMLAAAKGGVFWSDDHWSVGHWSDNRDLWWQRYRVTSDKAIALFRQAGDKRALLAALVYVAGGHVYHWGNFDRAQVLFEEALPLARELGSSSAEGASLRGLGEIAQTARNDPERARQLFEESLTVERAASNTVGIAFSLHSLAWRALLDRDAARAAQLSERAVRTYLEAGSLRQVVDVRLLRGVAALMEGNHSALDEMFRESIAEAHLRRFGYLVANWLTLIAASWAAQGRSLHGARLFAAATSACSIHYSGLRSFEALLDECLSVGRAQADAAAWQSAWEDGELMTLQQAMIYALEEHAIPNLG